MLPAMNNGNAPATRPVNRLESLFDRVFNDEFAAAGRGWPAAAPGRGIGPVSMWEDDDRLTIEMDLPGVAEQDVEITVLKDQLVVRAERRPVEGRRLLYNSRPFGRFERTIALPEAVDADQAHAEFEAGVLRISCAKRPEARPRRISVTSRTGG